MTRALLVMLAALSASGCGDEGSDAAFSPSDVEAPTPAPAAQPDENTGSLSLALTTHASVKLDAFDYAITGPGFSKAGSIDVSKSNTVSAQIVGIPVASGYSITLSGTSPPPGKASCSGSATFAIMAGAVTQVPVSIACHLEDAVVAPGDPVPAPLPPLTPLVLGSVLLAAGLRAARLRAARKT